MLVFLHFFLIELDDSVNSPSTPCYLHYLLCLTNGGSGRGPVKTDIHLNCMWEISYYLTEITARVH